MRRVFGPRKGDPRSFWSTKLGATIASVGIVLLVCVVFSADYWHLRLQPEMQEVRAELLSGDYLKRQYEFIASVDPVPRRGRRRLRSNRPREWNVARSQEGVAGHFTFEVEGWRKHAVRKVVREEQIVVSFEKSVGGGVKITKIDGVYIRYPVDPEWEKALQLLGGMR